MIELRVGKLWYALDWITETVITVSCEIEAGRSACLTILGIEIGSVDQELNLPQYKLKWVKQTIQHWRARKCCTLRGLQSVIRLLSHVCKVVHPGWVFLGCMFWLATSVQHLPHQLRLIKQRLLLNLEWWHCFLEAWNGTSLCGQFNPKLLVHMTHLGIGAVEPYLDKGDCFIRYKWQEDTVRPISQLMSFCPLWWLAHCGAESELGCTVLAQCDNEAVVADMGGKWHYASTPMSLPSLPLSNLSKAYSGQT